MKPRGLSDADYLAALLDLRNQGLDAISALRRVEGMDLVARAHLAERSAALVEQARVYFAVKTA